MPARKRAAASPPEDEPRRRPRRTTSTPKKSAYFEDEDDESADYKEEDVSEEEDIEDDEEEEKEPPKRGRGRPAAKAKAKAPAKRNGAKPNEAKKEKEEDVADEYQEDDTPDDDDDDEDEDDDEEVPRVVISKLITLRPLDGVEYADTKLHKNTLAFLKDLKANNTRPWMKSHDGEYRRALSDFNTFIETFTPLVSEADETVPELPLRDLTFRIHRDMRFSKNPTPYKPHFSAAWSRTGRKGPYACYYLHVEPGKAFVGGGLWCPPAEQVRALRESIDLRPARWRGVLNGGLFKRMFLKGKGKGKGDEEAVDAFCQGNQENALKTKPKGWEADHRDIGLLKLRSYTVGTRIEDGLFAKEDAQETLKGMFATMEPFITFLNRIVMPDPGDTSDDEDEEGQQDGDEDDDEEPEEGDASE